MRLFLICVVLALSAAGCPQNQGDTAKPAASPAAPAASSTTGGSPAPAAPAPKGGW